VNILPETRRPVRLEGHDRFGGTEGNEILTSATAVLLTVLLAAALRWDSLLRAMDAWHA
jgi:hypothetical protein